MMAISLCKLLTYFVIKTSQKELKCHQKNLKFHQKEQKVNTGVIGSAIIYDIDTDSLLL